MNKNSTKLILAIVLLAAAAGLFLWQSGMLSSSKPVGAPETTEEAQPSSAGGDQSLKLHNVD